MTIDPAVTAAAEALTAHADVEGWRGDEWYDYACRCGWSSTDDSAASFRTHVAAAIVAEVRERIAAEIGAMTLKQIGMGVSLFDAARDQAARIARGQT